MPSWVIGSGSDCDVVVDSPLASGRHCQLTQSPDGLTVNDLGSTNGTYVNGTKIAGPIRLTARDTITLGRTVPFPWPPELTTSYRIGRLADNDIVVDDARVSGHHARLIVVTGYRTMIDDIDSSNGTFLNSPDRRVTGPTPIAESDTLYFGTLAVPAARLLRTPARPDMRAETQSAGTTTSDPSHHPVASLPISDFVRRRRWLLAWIAQVPVIATLIVLICSRQPAATTFALAMAAIWLGSSLALLEVAEAATGSLFSLGRRLAVFAMLCVLASVTLITIVYMGSGLKGRALAMAGVLAMTSLAGLLLGLAVSGLVRNRVAAAGGLLASFLAMIALGGWFWPLPTMNPPLRLVAGAVPSRWAFEGLLLLEASGRQTPGTGEQAAATPDDDLAERFFPAISERMGVAADALALGSMLIGLAAVVLFIRPPHTDRP